MDNLSVLIFIDVNTTEAAPNCDEQQDIWFRFAVNAILSGILISGGLCGNLISMMVLLKDRRPSSMNVLLSVLAFYDAIFLLTSIYYIVMLSGVAKISSEFSAQINDIRLTRYLTPAAWFIGNIARTGRNWITVVVAIDRFIVVYKPLNAAQHSGRRHAKVYSAVVTFLSILYNLPRLIEYKPITSSTTGREIMGKNPYLSDTFRTFYGGVSFPIFVVIGPLFLLTLFNILLTMNLIRASQIRARMTRDVVSRQHDTKMLIFVIGIFIVTELPGCITQILIQYMEMICQFWDYAYTTVNFLTIVNSSVNFLIYCFCGTRFRGNMYRMFCRKRYLAMLAVRGSLRNNWSATGSYIPAGFPSPQHYVITRISPLREEGFSQSFVLAPPTCWGEVIPLTLTSGGASMPLYK